MKWTHSLVIIIVFFTMSFPVESRIEEFDTSGSSIPLYEIHHGGPDKDGIPAIDKPLWGMIEDADFMKASDLVIGLKYNGVAKAYPIKILNWHEVVNDTIAGMPIVVTWCPLSHSAIVLERYRDLKTYSFGVSGLLHNNNLMLYDRETLSLWPQITHTAVTGASRSTTLAVVASRLIPWEDWKRENPTTLLLLPNTNEIRNYEIDPYEKYRQYPTVMFPMPEIDGRLEAKAIVLGVKIGERMRAYPLFEIKKDRFPINDTLNGKAIRVHSGNLNTAYATDEMNNLIPGALVYWFAWSAFYPETDVYKSPTAKKMGLP